MNTPSPAAAWPLNPVAESWSEPPSILVVDDEFGIRSVVARALSRRGYRVAMAANGREAVTMMESDQHYALVLLDVDMPEMSGLQALPFIRRAAPGVPVAYLSGHLNDDSAMGVLRSGADAVIPKPFELSRLLQAVDRIIERHRLAVAADRGRRA